VVNYCMCVLSQLIILGGQIKYAEMGGTCSTHGEGKKYMHNFGRKLEEMESFGRRRRRRKNNIKINFK